KQEPILRKQVAPAHPPRSDEPLEQPAAFDARIRARELHPVSRWVLRNAIPRARGRIDETRPIEAFPRRGRSHAPAAPRHARVRVLPVNLRMAAAANLAA